MPKLFFSVVTVCLCCTALTGCGTKGPLYIPEQRYPQKDSMQEKPKTAPQANSDATAPSKEY